MCRRSDLDFCSVETTRDFRDLACEIGRAARQIGDLVAEISAIAQAVTDRIEQRHTGQGSQRHDRRRAGIDAEAEIEHRTDGAGDKHDADRNEDGADATHAVYPVPSAGTGATPPRAVRFA